MMIMSMISPAAMYSVVLFEAVEVEDDDGTTPVEVVDGGPTTLLEFDVPVTDTDVLFVDEADPVLDEDDDDTVLPDDGCATHRVSSQNAGPVSA
jgi:hypothetical protein